MAAYESDSSGDEGEYTVTNVLLGYASKEPTEDTFSQLGGHPTWLEDKTAPNGAFAKCKVCNGYLSLLFQLHSDLPERFLGHERRLYLFGCRRKACRRKEGSIRGIRATRASAVPQQQAKTEISSKPQAASGAPQQTNIGDSLFGVKSPTGSNAPANPFATSSTTPQANPFATSSTTPQANPFASTSSTPVSATSTLAAKPPQNPFPSDLPQTFADKVRISSPPPKANPPTEPWPAESAFPPPYPSSHLDADKEYLEPDNNTAIPTQARLTNDLDSEAGASASMADAKDAFESSMDKTFQRFADRLAQNSEQVLRYEFGGLPLLYSKTDAVGKLLAPALEGGNVKVQTAGGRGGSRMPRCGNCGAERVFEMQLTPHAITELEAEDVGLEGMDWGTVVLGTCGADCVEKGKSEGEVGYVEEWVGVQWEEQVSKR